MELNLWYHGSANLLKMHHRYHFGNKKNEAGHQRVTPLASHACTDEAG
jgi:hypothetical protein